MTALLSVIAGMVDVTSYLSLGHVFTAHVTGNVVVLSALIVQRATVGPAEILVLPMFVAALGLSYVLALASKRRGPRLARFLLGVQCALLEATAAVAIITHASRDPLGPGSLTAVLLAVSAMACQYALLRLAVPNAVSTAVMTGNLSNAVLATSALLVGARPFVEPAARRLHGSLPLLAGFCVGCIAAAAALPAFGDWTWILPAAAAAVALAVYPGR